MCVRVCVCVCVCARACVRARACVKRPTLPTFVVDECYRNLLYYYIIIKYSWETLGLCQRRPTVDLPVEKST